MNRKRRKLLLLFVLLLLLVGLPAWWLNREIQQERLNTALIAAIKANDTNAALQALERGADANAKDLGGSNPSLGDYLRQFWNRLSRRHAQDRDTRRPTAIQVLLNGIKDSDGYGDDRPENAAILKALLERGADPNVSDAEGIAPLHYACEWDYTASVRLLLQYGANVNRPDRDGETPLHYAGCSQFTTPLLLESGADPNARSNAGNTPLHSAICCRNLNAVRLLITRGANIHVRNDNGWTPLHDAADVRNEEIARYLLTHGAEVNEQTPHGDTPLSLAQKGGRDELIRLLKKHGAR